MIDPDAIRQYVDVNTDHITSQDYHLLMDGIHCYPAESYGAWMWTSGPDDLQTDLESLECDGYSKELRDIFRSASEQNIKFIKFDTDGAIHNNLPIPPRSMT